MKILHLYSALLSLFIVLSCKPSTSSHLVSGGETMTAQVKLDLASKEWFRVAVLKPEGARAHVTKIDIAGDLPYSESFSAERDSYVFAPEGKTPKFSGTLLMKLSDKQTYTCSFTNLQLETKESVECSGSGTPGVAETPAATKVREYVSEALNMVDDRYPGCCVTFTSAIPRACGCCQNKNKIVDEEMKKDFGSYIEKQVRFLLSESTPGSKVAEEAFKSFVGTCGPEMPTNNNSHVSNATIKSYVSQASAAADSILPAGCCQGSPKKCTCCQNSYVVDSELSRDMDAYLEKVIRQLLLVAPADSVAMPGFPVMEAAQRIKNECNATGAPGNMPAPTSLPPANSSARFFYVEMRDAGSGGCEITNCVPASLQEACSAPRYDGTCSATYFLDGSCDTTYTMGAVFQPQKPSNEQWNEFRRGCPGG